MTRKKPNSVKNKKLQLQTKRAAKLVNQSGGVANADASNLAALDKLKSKKRPSNNRTRRAATSSRLSAIDGLVPGGQDARAILAEARKKSSLGLESRFMKLPSELLQHYRLLASTEPLERPIPRRFGVLTVEEVNGPETIETEDEGTEGAKTALPALTCPKRPKWHYEMSKKEVEKNEEGMFSKWLLETKKKMGVIESAIMSRRLSEHPSDPLSLLRPSPTYFETNLNVWRQLWRVTEQASILLILVDVRCPLMHFPPSLQTYVAGLKPRKKVVLVLTKTDLVPAEVATAWKTYFEDTMSQDNKTWTKIVLMESYKQKEKGDLSQGTQPLYDPGSTADSRRLLIAALREAHAELIAPPAVVSNDPTKLSKWKPRVIETVDWDALETPDPNFDHLKARHSEKPAEENHREEGDEREGQGEGSYNPPKDIRDPKSEPDPFLTIGLIGQPNVGKSSLLNAMMGRKVVRASRTPGKTKHFQTIFWSPEVRLVDCPGLVCPSAAGMEQQVLGGVIPIQNVEPVLHFVMQRIPLEDLLKLAPLGGDTGMSQPGPSAWTTDALLSAYALSQGFITAKAGRPDVYRAGASILRALQSSAIPWAYLPEDASLSCRRQGVWLDIREGDQKFDSSKEELEDGTDVDANAEEEEAGFIRGSEGSQTSQTDLDSDDGDASDSSFSEADEMDEVTPGRFAALAIDESGSAGESEEESLAEEGLE